MKVWLADVDVQDPNQSDHAGLRRYTCKAAVWAKDKASAVDLIGLFLAITPYQLQQVTTCVPATDDPGYGQTPDIAALVANVSDRRLVEFGDFVERGSRVKRSQQGPQSLQEAVLALDYQHRPVFAVLDGAQFDNLPALLLDGGFSARALYLNTQGSGVDPSLTAPQLVVLDPADSFAWRGYHKTVEALFELIGDQPRAVFWQCSAGLDALFFHLRKTNKVLIPRAYFDAHDDLNTKGDTASHAFVAFRHADANALAQTLPALTPSEASRLFGPCNAVLFAPDAKWAGDRPWVHIPRPYTWPDPQPGPLELSPATMDKIETRRRDRLLHKTVMYLRKVLPPNFQHLSLSQLDKAARAARQSGRALGLKGLAAHNRWAYLCIITEGKIAKSKEVRAFVRHGNDTPDAQVKLAMEETLRTLKEVAVELRA